MSEPEVVSIGSPAPEFTLPSGNGTDVRLADFRSKKNVYLFFIREYI
jgi:peroxiredoxin